MKESEFNKLKPEDVVIDRHGNKVKIFDIHRGLKMIQVYGDSWRSYLSFSLPKRRDK